jgi:hypothetical protein
MWQKKLSLSVLPQPCGILPCGKKNATAQIATALLQFFK